MQLTYRWKWGGSDNGGCPALYDTDQGGHVVQGIRTDDPTTVWAPADILHRLEGFDPDRLAGIVREGQGYLVAGDPLDATTAAQLRHLAIDETAVYVRGLI